MNKNLITLILTLLIIPTVLLASGGTTYLDDDKINFGSSALGTRKLCFDETPDSTSVCLNVNPSTDDATLFTDNFTIGEGIDEDLKIKFDFGSGAGNGYIGYDTTSKKIVVSHDGSDEFSLSRGGAGGENYLSDGSFEAAFSGTCNTGTCTNPDTGAIQEGAKALNISLSSQTGDVEYCATNTSRENQNFEAIAWIKTSSALFNFCASDDSGSGDNCVDVTSNDKYEQYYVTKTIPASGKSCWRVTTDGPTTASARVDFTAIRAMGAKIVNKVYSQNYYISQQQSSMSDRSNEVEFNLGTATIENKGDALLVVSDDAGNTRTKVTSSYDDVDVTACFSASSVDAAGSQRLEIYINGATTAQHGSTAAADTQSANACTTIRLAKDDYLTFAAASGLNNDPGTAKLRFTAVRYEQDQVISQTLPVPYEIKFYNQTNAYATTASGSYVNLVDTDFNTGYTSKNGAVISDSVSGTVGLKAPYLAPNIDYEVCFYGSLLAENVASQSCSFQLTDGTNTVGPTNASAGTPALGTAPPMCKIVRYATGQSNLEWNLQAKRVGGAANCAAEAHDANNSITITIKPVGGTIAASLKNYRYYEYYGQGNASLANNSEERSQWDTLAQDDDNSITTGSSWVFTSKRNQLCQVNSKVTHTASGSILYPAASVYYLKPYVNGADFNDRCLFNVPVSESTSSSKTMICPFTLKLVAGDTLYFMMFQESGETATMETSRTNSNIKMTCFDN